MGRGVTTGVERIERDELILVSIKVSPLVVILG